MNQATPRASWCPVWAVLVIPLLLVTGCSNETASTGSALSGQVQVPVSGGAPKVTHYAASRFLEQAAFGPGPDALGRVKAIGVDGWIEEQSKLPASKIVTPEAVANFDTQDQAAGKRAWDFQPLAMMNHFIGSSDQLRLRTTWALSNFLVVSTRKIAPYGASEYFNTLQTHAFGNYGDLLKAITVSPAMGNFLDNHTNSRYSLNENYGRELLQLFSVGVVMLNPDGTLKRDAAGKPIPTYDQGDVIGATRALTGWNFVPRAQRPNDSNWANYGLPMEAGNADAHDKTEKIVLGSKIPAGQDAAKDLDSLVSILMNHPNTPPFVSLRLIQAMTTSDPSPAYVGRVSGVFSRTKGDLAQTVKAILLDPEARAGDDPARSSRTFGRIKEPLLVHVSVLRGLGCRAAYRTPWDNAQALNSWTQQPFNAESVFNFYPPNHRAPGSNLLAPEQKMLNATEFGNRGAWNGHLRDESLWLQAGCDAPAFKAAAAQGDDALLRLLSDRYFRGVMPAAVRSGLQESTRSASWLRDTPTQYVGALIDLMTLTPDFAAVE